MDYRTKYPRLRFADGGTLDLDNGVPCWEQEDYEATWREAHVRVEWMLTPKGRLDHVLSGVMVTRNPPNEGS